MPSDHQRARRSPWSRASLSALMLLGCSTLIGVEDGIVQGSCSTEAECAPGYGCLQRACRSACESDQDCGSGSRCLRYGLTAACIPSQLDCGEGCEGPTTCVANVCRTNCETKADCAGGQACNSGACVGTDAAHDAPESVGDAGMSSGGGANASAGAGASTAAGAGAMSSAGQAGAPPQGGEGGVAGSALIGSSGATPGGANAGGEGGAQLAPECEPACGGQAPVCLNGGCVACSPSDDSPRCSNAGVPQSCGETGQWQDGVACKQNEACTAGKCECSGKVCGDACVKTDTDVKNCGACGRQCAVGTCKAGACQPVELATATSPGGIAVGGGKLFWTDNHKLMSANLATLKVTEVPIASTDAAICGNALTQVIANATSVYWQAYGVCQINHSVAGDTGKKTGTNVMYGGASGTQALAGYGGNVFNVEPEEYMMHSSDGSYYWYFYTAGGGQVPALAVDATHVYWLQGKGEGLTFVFKHPVPKLTDMPIELAKNQDPGEGIAAYDGYVYWTTTTGKVQRVSANGGIVTTLASGLNKPTGLVVDGSGVYWTNRNSAGSVMRMPHAGGQTTTLAANQNDANGIIADSTTVYFTNTAGGKVMMVSK